MEKYRNVCCPHCKKEQTSVGIIQEEKHYYRVLLSTGQWEDFNGSDEVSSQSYFCINCQKEIDSDVLEKYLIS